VRRHRRQPLEVGCWRAVDVLIEVLEALIARHPRSGVHHELPRLRIAELR